MVDSKIASGSATVDATPANVVVWAEDGPPTVTNRVSFELQGMPGIACDRIPWSAVSHGVVVDVSESCFVYDGSTTAPLANATLWAKSTLDAANEGSLELRFDVPPQEVLNVAVEVDALVVDMTFRHTQCGGGGTWGFWDI